MRDTRGGRVAPHVLLDLSLSGQVVLKAVVGREMSKCHSQPQAPLPTNCCVPAPPPMPATWHLHRREGAFPKHGCSETHPLGTGMQSTLRRRWNDSSALGLGKRETQNLLAIRNTDTWHLKKSQGLTPDTVVTSIRISIY